MGIGQTQERFAQANRLRTQGAFQPALQIYAALGKQLNYPAAILHNSAVCLLGLDRPEAALKLCKAAHTKDPRLNQSLLLQARIERKLHPIGIEAEHSLKALLATPGLDPAMKGQAQLELAELQLNAFCDAQSCAETVFPILNAPEFAEQARLSYLVSKFYSRTETDQEITDLALDYASTFLQKPLINQSRKRPAKRRRIGLLSSMFHGGPLYYLTVSAFTALAKSHDLILFNRSKKSDWATERFRALAKGEFACRGMNWQTLAQTIASEKLDVLYELGGWSDTEALKAVSTRPASKQYKWVGGQAMTTGLDCFDGFLSDEWHTPKAAQGLYTEPLVLLPEGYVRYTPPDYMPTPGVKDRGVIGVIGNPLKVNAEVFSRLGKKPTKDFGQPKELRLIDKRYAHPKVRERIEPLLSHFKGKVTWVSTTNHQEFLQELSRLEAILDTSPHSAGLTAREALYLGVRVIPPQKERMLFSSRHGIAAVTAYAPDLPQTELILPV